MRTVISSPWEIVVAASIALILGCLMLGGYCRADLAPLGATHQKSDRQRGQPNDKPTAGADCQCRGKHRGVLLLMLFIFFEDKAILEVRVGKTGLQFIAHFA